MGIVSLSFLATTLGAALAIRLAGNRVRRELVLLLASAIFILCIAGNAVLTIPFWTLVVLGFLAVRIAPRAQSLWAFAGLLVSIVLSWWWLRTEAPALLTAHTGTISGGAAVFGLSYAMFRILHMTVDARDDELGGHPGLRAYLCYLAFFPNYLAGPVQRFQHFKSQIDLPAPEVNAQTWLAAAKRAVTGVFKCSALAGSALAMHTVSLAITTEAGHPAVYAMAAMAAACLLFTAYLLFSFSGYMDIAISAGLVLGVTIPENFNQPWRAKNFLDFWSRWHITLSDWFRFYVFNPLLKSMMASLDRPRLAPYLGAIGYFVAFFLMGIWHGRTPDLILYGFVLGAGVSINKLFQVRMASSMGKRAYTSLCERPAYQIFSQALALAYFVLALYLLWKPEANELQIGSITLLGAVPLVLIACALLAWTTRLFVAVPAVFRTLTWAIVLAEALAAAAYLWVMGGVVPELIYQWL